MAFNRSAFSANKMSSELNTQAKSLSEGKVSYGGGNRKHNWFKLPAGITLYKKPEKPGKVVVNILPFQRKNGEVGFFHNVFVHQIPNAEGFGTQDYLCTGSSHCAACKMKAERDVDGAQWDDIKMYVPKKRTGILVNPVGTDEVQFLETSSANRGKALPEMISNQAIAMADGNSVVDFASLDEGQSVILVYGEQTFNGHKFTEVTSVAFRPRTEEISDETLNKIPDYIEMLNNVSSSDNDEMETLLNGGSVETKQTEEQAQDDFEKSVEAEMPKTAPSMDDFKVKSAPMPEGPLSEDDFKQNPMTIKKPAASDVFACPNGFEIASEYGCHRQCMKCQFADKCEKIAG